MPVSALAHGRGGFMYSPCICSVSGSLPGQLAANGFASVFFSVVLKFFQGRSTGGTCLFELEVVDGEPGLDVDP